MDYTVLQKSQLFYDMEEEEIKSMLTCLMAEQKKYKKDEFILRYGDRVDSIGLVLSGKVNIIKDDYWGNRNIIAMISAAHTFAESYACVQGTPLSVYAQAAEDVQIMFLNVRRIMTICTSACAFHTKLIQNLLALVASKNLYMNEKLTHLTKRTTREKLISYLSAESLKNGTRTFDIPFNRQQLADYLSVDRSAMSNELCKMRDEGLLEFEKSHFSFLVESLENS